jgi:PleD family two-component response regulator
MSPILLADDSSHAQRMGVRILREEGFEVVSLTDGEAVLERLKDVDPDLILADAFLPKRSGFDLCRYVKSHPLHRHVRVVLTAGLLEQFDEDEATRAGCDAVLKKPFEASAMMATIRPLLTEAQLARGLFAEAIAAARAVPVSADQEKNANGQPPSREVDPEQVQAAVTLALDAALPTLIHEITERVLVALGH